MAFSSEQVSVSKRKIRLLAPTTGRALAEHATVEARAPAVDQCAG